MPIIKLTGTAFTQRLAKIPGGRFELLVYPWGTSPADALVNGLAHFTFPVVIDDPNRTPTISANINRMLPDSVVFAVRYISTQRLPGFSDPVTFTDFMCRTRMVRTANNFVPSELMAFDIVSPTGIDVASMSDMLRAENIWVGMLPGPEGISVTNGLLDCNVWLNGWIGSFSGNAHLYFSLKAAKVPNPGRFLELELESADGIGLTKGIFLSEARKRVVPGVETALDDYVSEAIQDNLSQLDGLATALSHGQALTKTRGVLLHDFKLAATITSSLYVCYAVT